MAVMQALLKIKADVTGEEGVQRLGRTLGSLNDTAGRVSGGLRGMLGAAGGLSGALGALAPIVSGVGLAAMAKGAIDAADDMNDLAQKTGVSVEQLSRFKQAAEMSGTSIEAVGGAMVKLSKNISASLGEGADAAGESAAEIKERVKREMDAAADAVKESADRQVDAIKDGERRQLDAVKENADKRMDAIERESDARMDELNRRYRQEEKLLNDRYDDEADKLEEAADKRQRVEERAIEDRYEAQLEAIQESESIDKKAKADRLQALRRAQADELEAVRDRYQEEAKVRSRALRDREDADREAIDKRRKTEETALKSGFDAQREQVQKAADSQREIISKGAAASAAAVQKGADASIEALRRQAAAAGGLSEDMEELGLNGKGASKAFADLGIALRNSDGSIRATDQVMLDVADRFAKMPDGVEKTTLAMQIFGKSGAALIPMLNGGRESVEKLQATMSGDLAKAADEFNDKTVALNATMGLLASRLAEALLPVLMSVSDVVVTLAQGFANMNPFVQKLVVSAGLIAIAWGPISGTFGILLGLFQGIAALNIGGLIAGWAPVVISAFSGLLAWVGGTFIPALLAFFSGPVGWTVLALAAVVALAIAFREPILGFLSWANVQFQKGVDFLAKLAYNSFLKPWVELFNVAARTPITDVWKWIVETFNKGVDVIRSLLGKIARAAEAPFRAVIETIRGALNGVMSMIASGVNAAIGAINSLIGAYNRLPTPDIPFVPSVSVPQFAEGGVVNRPTLAMVGEGGEREYIIPESKMAGAAAAYMGGARGAAVLGSPAAINITTGPVMQQGGQNYVSMADLQRAMRATEAATLARIRTPAGRSALGIR